MPAWWHRGCMSRPGSAACMRRLYSAAPPSCMRCAGSRRSRGSGCAGLCAGPQGWWRRSAADAAAVARLLLAGTDRPSIRTVGPSAATAERHLACTSERSRGCGWSATCGSVRLPQREPNVRHSLQPLSQAARRPASSQQAHLPSDTVLSKAGDGAHGKAASRGPISDLGFTQDSL
jgi:hypothetical protein